MGNKLKKELNLLDIFCLASGAMISSGIFILPGLAYSQAGPLVFISYFIAGLLALLGTLSVIELATAMPKAGGDYFFVTRSLGPLVGTISSFLSWTALCLKSSFAIFGIAEVLHLTFGFPIFYSASLLCCFFVGLNLLGTKESVKFQVILVIGLFAIMLFLVLGGMGNLSLSNFKPLLPYGINKVLITAGFVFISFGGLLNISSIAGEVKDPVKNIPRGMFLALISVTFFYAMILIVVVGVLSPSELSGSLTPVADAGRLIFGKTGYFIISLGAILAFVTTANAGILSASRYPLALSEDKLLPNIISSLSKRKKTPVIAVCLTGFFIFACLLLDLTTLVKLGSIVILTLYILTNLAVIILREGRVQNYQPSFKLPFYPWTNIGGIVLFTFLIVDMGLVAAEISIGLVCFASLIYFLYGKKRHNIDYALLHLIKRVINKKMTNEGLEDELKQVIIDRDELKIDRFHNLVENGTIIDIQGKSEFDAFLGLLATSVSAEIGLKNKDIIELFKKREQEGSTAFTPFIAIPHIIIPGENKFKLVIARCNGGVAFNKENDQVKAIFVLFGTKDERNFHLKVLAAIAKIVQNKNFQKKWLLAKNEQQLRHIILLGERKR